MTATALAVRGEARAAIAHHSKSFALASRLLGARLRDDVSVLYTWCRRADDAVDTVDPREAPAAIARLDAELELAYRGGATDPILAAFGALAARRRIPRAYPDELVRGMAMDADGTRYRSVDELIAYGWRVAGVVGVMMAHVFGVRDDAALVPAAQLGIAMQLTNICRDVREDWDRGRLYVPDELCPGLADELGAPLRRAAGRPLADAIRALLALADRYYRASDRGIAALPWRAALAVRAARRIYAAIGERLARDGFDVFAPRAVVPRGRKLALASVAAARTLLALPGRALAPRARIPTRVLELADVARL